MMSHYAATFRKEKPKPLIFVCYALFAILSLLNIGKTLSGKQAFSYFDAVWVLVPILVGYRLIDLFSAKTVLSTADGVLTVTESNFFIKKTRSYRIAEMEQIEVEPVKIKTFLWPGTSITAEKVLTYFYHEKEVAIGFNLKNFDAEALLQKLC